MTLHSGPEIGKKLDKLITFYSLHIFSKPIQGKMAQGIRFYGQITQKRFVSAFNFEIFGIIFGKIEKILKFWVAR
jgi:hypothetical protein